MTRPFAPKTIERKKMNDDHVEIKFSPPRKYREVKKSYFLVEELQLPIACTTLEKEDSPDVIVVTSAWIPQWLAKKEGLESSPSPGKVEGAMSRWDFYLLGATMAFIIRGDAEREAKWNAKKLARALVEEVTE